MKIFQSIIRFSVLILILSGSFYAMQFEMLFYVHQGQTILIRNVKLYRINTTYRTTEKIGDANTKNFLLEGGNGVCDINESNGTDAHPDDVIWAPLMDWVSCDYLIVINDVDYITLKIEQNWDIFIDFDPSRSTGNKFIVTGNRPHEVYHQGVLGVDYDITLDNDIGDGVSDGTVYFLGNEETVPYTANLKRELFPFVANANNYQVINGIKRIFQEWADSEGMVSQPIAKYLLLDDDIEYTANFLPAHNITVQNEFPVYGNEGDLKLNSQTVNAPHSVSDNTADLNVEAYKQTYNYIEFSFKHWKVNSTVVSNPAITTFDNNGDNTYTAVFEGEPILWGRSIICTSAVGLPIRLDWYAHPNNDISGYEIWRKVGSADGVMVDEVDENTLTWTDPLYSKTNSTSDPLIKYDIRAVWYNVPTDHYYQAAVYGHIPAKIGEEGEEGLITEYKIENYPNPFNPTTVIRYQLPEAGQVSIKVYDMQGQEVADLVNEVKTSGVYAVKFNATHLSSGTYFYVIRTNNYSETKKMILMK